MLFILFGPIIYENVKENEIRKLEECYVNCLKLASKNNIKTIAFPCISTGEFRFPKELASKIAINTVIKYLKENQAEFEKVIFNVFTEEDFEIYNKKIREVI